MSLLALGIRTFRLLPLFICRQSITFALRNICFQYVGKQIPIEGDTSVRLRRCGLKGVALYYFILNEYLVYIKPVLVRVLHGAAEHIAALTLIDDRIGEIMIVYTLLPGAIRQRTKVDCQR